MSNCKADVKAAAALLLDWFDNNATPYEKAIALAQADEAEMKAFSVGACPEAQSMAFARRFLESVSRDNAGMIASLSGGEA